MNKENEQKVKALCSSIHRSIIASSGVSSSKEAMTANIFDLTMEMQLFMPLDGYVDFLDLISLDSDSFGFTNVEISIIVKQIAGVSAIAKRCALIKENKSTFSESEKITSTLYMENIKIFLGKKFMDVAESMEDEDADYLNETLSEKFSQNLNMAYSYILFALKQRQYMTSKEQSK